MTVTPELLATLKAEHGKVFVLENESVGVQIVCKAPNRLVYKRFKSEIADENKRTGALEKLLMECVVYPSREEFDKIVDEYPALPDSFGAALGVEIGMGEAQIKKA